MKVLRKWWHLAPIQVAMLSVTALFFLLCRLAASCEYCAQGRAALCEAGAKSNAAGELPAGGIRWHEPETDDAQDVDVLTRMHHHLGVSAFAEMTVVSTQSVVKNRQRYSAGSSGNLWLCSAYRSGRSRQYRQSNSRTKRGYFWLRRRWSSGFIGCQSYRRQPDRCGRCAATQARSGQNLSVRPTSSNQTNALT